MSLLDWFRPRKPSIVPPPPEDPGPPLDAAGFLRSDLWFDQPSAHATIDGFVHRGEIDEAMADNFRHFVDKGYMVISLDLDDAVFDDIERTVDRLWEERPDNVAYAYQSLLKRFRDAEPEHRSPSCRIADLHTAGPEALELFLNRQVFDVIERIFGQPAVATQSLYFEWGSQQGLHRDPVYVQMKEPSHLLATWLALEDIGPDCGPLIYVPGSHRLPYYQFEPGRYTVDFSRDGQDVIQKGGAWDEQQCRDAGLELEVLTCKRGDVLVWHHSLLHGGSFPTNPELTRKSFVVHYSTLSTMDRVHNSYLDAGDSDAVTHMTSDRVLERNGCHGFDSPLNVQRAKSGGVDSEADPGAGEGAAS